MLVKSARMSERSVSDCNAAEKVLDDGPTCHFLRPEYDGNALSGLSVGARIQYEGMKATDPLASIPPTCGQYSARSPGHAASSL